MTPPPGHTSSGTWVQRLYTEVGVAFLALLVAGISLVYTINKDFADDAGKTRERSIRETDRLFEPTFATSLSFVLDHAYDFLENDATARLKGKERFETFWNSFDTNVDQHMLILAARLQSVQDCIKRGDCDRREVYSRFPTAIYQALFFLREFVLLPQELWSAAPIDDPTGWWFGTDVYDLMQDYCTWLFGKKPGREVLWSPRHEQMRRAHGIPTPSPCLPPRTKRKK